VYSAFGTSVCVRKKSKKGSSIHLFNHRRSDGGWKIDGGDSRGKRGTLLGTIISGHKQFGAQKEVKLKLYCLKEFYMILFKVYCFIKALM